MTTSILIAAGGTGGHVYPAQSVVEQLLAVQPDAHVVWIGRQGGFEERVVAEGGYQWLPIAVSSYRNRGMLGKLSAVWQLIWAVWQVIVQLRRQRPAMVLATGSFVGMVGGLAAICWRVPLYIQEQNKVPSLSNRVLARFATKVFTAYRGCLEGYHPELVGNPLRSQLRGLSEQTRERQWGDWQKRPLRLLVIGGSQGAQVMNQAMPQALAQLQSANIDLWHIYGGAGQSIDWQARYAQAGWQRTVQLSAFEQDMSVVYQWADAVIARAGAMSIAEITAAGLPCILVPYANAADNHQMENALDVLSAKACWVVEEGEEMATQLAKYLTIWLSSPSTMRHMAQQAASRRHIDAEKRIVQAMLG